MLLNGYTKGHTWTKPGVTKDKVLKRNGAIAASAPLLWEYAQGVIEEAYREGYLKD